MKVAVIGDNHFGAGFNFGKPDLETGINSRLIDYEKTLENIITDIINAKIELVIFLGDIFETRHPTSQQMVSFYRQIIRLSTAKITTYIIMGNHDYQKTRKINSSLDPIKELNIPYINVFTDIELMTFTDSKNETINVLLFPYRNRQSYDTPSNDQALTMFWNEINTAKSKALKNCPIIACGHMMMEQTIGNDVGDYGSNELILPFEMFEGIDITINGHIHRPSILNKHPIFVYSGSMECKDFSEREHKKTYIIYDSNKTGLDSLIFNPINTRKFVDFELDYSRNFPENPMKNIFEQIDNEELKDSIIRFSIMVPETKVVAIDIAAIRSRFYDCEVSCISSITVSPVISKQLRNQKINEAPDDISAFKHYVSSQNNVDSSVLSIGLSIITAELEE